MGTSDIMPGPGGGAMKFTPTVFILLCLTEALSCYASSLVSSYFFLVPRRSRHVVCLARLDCPASNVALMRRAPIRSVSLPAQPFPTSVGAVDVTARMHRGQLPRSGEGDGRSGWSSRCCD